MAANPGNPQKPRRQTPYEHVKYQLDVKTRECEQLQEANTGLGISLSNVRQNIEIQRTAIQFMEKAHQRALSRRIHVDNYINALNERIAYLKKPWWSRNAAYADSLRTASDTALDRINRFDMDKDPSATDAPGAIMGLEKRPPQNPSNYASTELDQHQIASNAPYQATARETKFKRDGYI